MAKNHYQYNVSSADYETRNIRKLNILIFNTPKHPYLPVDFTRHLFSCLECLKIGIPDAEKV